METFSSLKQMEGMLSVICDHASATKAELEELLFRAQHIAAAQKKSMPVNDTMFDYDLQAYRRGIRTFAGEISGLPAAFDSLERGATYDEKAAKLAASLVRLTMRLMGILHGLHDTALLAQQHIRTANLKIEAFYLVNEIEDLVTRGQGLPAVANKILVRIQTPPPGNAPPAASAQG